MTANTPASRKAKGRDFQIDIAKKIKDKFQLEDRDVVSNPNSVCGEDIILSNKAKILFPFSIECKRTENLNIWKSIKQNESNVKDNRIPLLIFKRNHSDSYCCLDFETFIIIWEGYSKKLRN